MAISFFLLPNGTLQQTGDADDDVFFGDLFIDGLIRRDDRMIGGAGNDTMSAFDGNNVMLGQGGNDTMLIGGTTTAWDQGFGGVGNDQFLALPQAVDTTTPHVVDGGAGFDRLNLLNLGGGISLDGQRVAYDGRTILQIAAIESFVGTIFNDRLVVDDVITEISAGLGNDTLIGWDSDVTGVLFMAGQGGNDRIFGGSADEFLFDGDEIIRDPNLVIHNDNDILRGGDGDDTLFSHTGNDTLNGQGGNDVLIMINSLGRANGGAGDDEIRFHVDPDVEPLDALQVINRLQEDLEGLTLSGGTGFDTVDFTHLSTDVLSPHPEQGLRLLVDRGTGFELASGANGRFQFDGFERFILTERNDILLGGSTPLVVNGEDGNDYIAGGSADDILDGGPGNDRVLGGAGHNTIWGSEGNDLLGSGPQSDDFAFDVSKLAGTGRNRITGFETEGENADRLVLLGDTPGTPSFGFEDLEFRQIAAGVVIAYQNWDVILLNVLVENLKESLFAFEDSVL